MKLVIATPLYPPEAGGPATYAKLLEDHFPYTTADGTPVEVVLVNWRDYNGPKGIRHLNYFFGVLHAARTADVVLALDPVSTGFPASLAASVAKKPFIAKVVGDFAWEQGTQRFGVTGSLDEFVRKGWMNLPVALLRAVQTYVAHSAHAIIVPSEYLKGIVTSWGILPEKITVIYNSIELPRASSTTSETNSSSMEIVSVGRLVPWKGMLPLITAVAQIRKTIPDVALTIIGSGPDAERLAVQGALELGSAVSFPGSLSHEETLARMRSSRVLVLNSTYEGLSHVLIEGLLLECAIVATDAGGNRELIADQENGLLIPVGDNPALEEALTLLLTDSAVRARLQAGACASATRFTVDRMITATRALVQSVL